MTEAVGRHFGISRLLDYQVAAQVADGSIEIILEDYEPKPKPIYVVHREGRLASTRVRSFIDFLAERLQSNQMLSA